VYRSAEAGFSGILVPLQEFASNLIGGLFGTLGMASEVQIYLDGMNAQYSSHLI